MHSLASVFYPSGSHKLHKTQTDPPLILFFLEFLKDSQDRRVATVKEAF